MDSLRSAVAWSRNLSQLKTPMAKQKRDLRRKRIKKYAGEATVTLICFLLAGAGHFFVNPKPLVFVERDPYLSFPMVRETVPKWMLFSIAIGVPCLVVAAGHAYHALKHQTTLWKAARSYIWVILTLLQTLSICFAITTGLKGFAGQPRPNFFALCDYAGYRHAVATGNFTDYFARTTPGVLGDLSKCESTRLRDRADAQHSFASGHTTVAFAGMTFATLYLRAAFGVADGSNFNVQSAISAIPIAVAVFIAVTRIRDYYHRTADIIAGAAIGAISALAGWNNYMAHRRAHVAPRHGAALLNQTHEPLLSIVGASPNPHDVTPVQPAAMAAAVPVITPSTAGSASEPDAGGMATPELGPVPVKRKWHGPDAELSADEAADVSVQHDKDAAGKTSRANDEHAAATGLHDTGEPARSSGIAVSTAAGLRHRPPVHASPRARQTVEAAAAAQTTAGMRGIASPHTAAAAVRPSPQDADPGWRYF